MEASIALGVIFAALEQACSGHKYTTLPPFPPLAVPKHTGYLPRNSRPPIRLESRHRQPAQPNETQPNVHDNESPNALAALLETILAHASSCRP
ncbi:hypothetical protein N657DRAFT_331898 [Parathielavia appendiculata]|uniref:Uncharacterized protein n=1 Tax=Parathielavia appendiculata TaxID=2587402 RepID=A0AAN6U1K4_9PEZI|nr:hypothetical protein N657DRAFT_331898 [Parathielavia appendiculata]